MSEVAAAEREAGRTLVASGMNAVQAALGLVGSAHAQALAAQAQPGGAMAMLGTLHALQSQLTGARTMIDQGLAMSGEGGQPAWAEVQAQLMMVEQHLTIVQSQIPVYHALQMGLLASSPVPVLAGPFTGLGQLVQAQQGLTQVVVLAHQEVAMQKAREAIQEAEGQAALEQSLPSVPVAHPQVPVVHPVVGAGSRHAEALIGQ
jgi:hypothetical protein